MIGSGAAPGLFASAGAALGGLFSSGYNYIRDSYYGNLAADTWKGIKEDFSEAQDTIADGMLWLKDKTEELAEDTYDFASDVYDNPSILTDALAMSWDDVKNGVTDAANYVKDFAEDIWNQPEILVDALKGSLETASNIYDKIGEAIYNTVTDPAKAWDFVKDTVGINNFANCIDPNRSLLQRFKEVGVGVAKLYATLATAGQASAALRGATKGAAAAESALAGRAVGVLERGVVKPPPVAPRMPVRPGPNYTTAKVFDGTPPAMPKPGYTSLQNVADEAGVQIHVRPSNPASQNWIESGKAVPKSHDVLSKSLNPVDELIGGPKNQEGLVSYFKPKEPPQAALDKMRPEFREKVMSRVQQRNDEFNRLQAQMEKLQAQGKFDVRDGIVHDMKTGKPVAGDIDIFDITKFDGSTVPESTKQQVVDRLRNGFLSDSSKVEHGALTSWDKSDYAFDAVAKQKMMNAAREGGEGVITINPHNSPTHSFLKPDALK